MTTWGLINHRDVGAAEGLAMDEALMLGHGRTGRSVHDATLRLYTYRPHCALVGRFQSVADEVDLEVAGDLGIDVARRPTGGGAIIMGAGQLGVAVTTRAPADCSPRDVLARYAHGVQRGLARIGIAATFAGKNDLQVDGRKIAGLGLHVDADGALLFHASVLADLDIPLMLRVLRIPGAKLSDKGVERVQERVTTIAREVGHAVDIDELAFEMSAAFSNALDADLQLTEPTGPQRRLAARLQRDRYASDLWTHQRSPRRDANGTELLKTPEGLVRVYVSTHASTVKSVLVTGDFNVVPDGVKALEATLRWTPATREQVVEATTSAVGAGVLGVAPQTLADAVWRATERALEHAAGAHPVRPSGSCYFPDPAAPSPLVEQEVA